jgi:hypothetical protein
MVKGKTVISDSCFPPETLVLIKSSYNKFHPNEKIFSTDISQIWNELKEKITTCNREDCWLNQIEDINLRKKLKYKSFTPEKPQKWKKNPTEWLSNFDILDVLRQYEETYSNFHIIGPTPIDFDSRPPDTNGACVWEELCNFNLQKYFDTGKTKLGIVFNLDKHDKGGSHWVSMFVDLEDKFVFYMDSAGNKIPKEIDILLQKIINQGLAMKPSLRLHFYENCPLEHQMGTTECGMYSLYFIITMLTGKTENNLFKNYFDKIRYFKDKRIPDKNMIRYRNLFFND